METERAAPQLHQLPHGDGEGCQPGGSGSKQQSRHHLSQLPGTGHTDPGQELVWNRTGGERQSDFDQLGQLNPNGGGGGGWLFKGGFG
jgi:hypothetical protein